MLGLELQSVLDYPPCGPRFGSQVPHLHFAPLIVKFCTKFVCVEKVTRINKKLGQTWPISKTIHWPTSASFYFSSFSSQSNNKYAKVAFNLTTYATWKGGDAVHGIRTLTHTPDPLPITICKFFTFKWANSSLYFVNFYHFKQTLQVLPQIYV